MEEKQFQELVNRVIKTDDKTLTEESESNVVYSLQYFKDHEGSMLNYILKNGVRSVSELCKVLDVSYLQLVGAQWECPKLKDEVDEGIRLIDKALFDRQREDYLLALEKRRELIQQGDSRAIDSTIKEYNQTVMNQLLIEEKKLTNERIRKEINGELMEQQVLFINGVKKDEGD